MKIQRLIPNSTNGHSAQAPAQPVSVPTPPSAAAPPKVSPSNPAKSRSTSSSPTLKDKHLQEMFNLKSRLHRSLIDVIDLDMLLQSDRQIAQHEIEQVLAELIRHQTMPMTAAEKEQVIHEVVNETFGLGPLEPLLADASVDEILVNNSQTVYIEREGKLGLTSVRFKDDTHLRHIINRIVSRIGRRIDEASPMVDARLPDGSRVNAIIPPLALDGPCVSIRKFREMPLTVDEMINYGSFTRDMIDILKCAVESKMNILVSGGTGSGKTTLLNTLSSFIPHSERIVTIEDAAELRLQQPHAVRLETRPGNNEGKGTVTARDLVRNSLRMRPDRIVVGEVRGGEAMDMLQAMNTGHDGSLTTIHANTPRDALSRIETMVLLAAANLDTRSINKQIVSAIQLVVQIRRFPDGKRRLETISELTGMEGTTISMQDLVCFQINGRNADGKIMGEFKVQAVKPRFLEQARDMGAPIPSCYAEDQP